MPGVAKQIDGEAVRILRELRRLDPDVFASRIGISPSYLRDLETGARTLSRNPDLRGRIAEVLGVPRRMIECLPDDLPED